MNKNTEKEKKIKVKDYVYNFDEEKIKEYREIINDVIEERNKYLKRAINAKYDSLYDYNSLKCDFLKHDIIDLHFLILNLFNKYGFVELFKDMEEYESKILENFTEEQLAVNNTNKNLENLKNRIGLIYYLYENKKNKNITTKDVNKLTKLVNMIMDITNLLNKYFEFYPFYFKSMLKNKDIKKDIMQNLYFESARVSGLQDIFYNLYFKKLLGNDFKFELNRKLRENKKLITDFHENIKTYLIDVYEFLNSNVKDLYDILKKGNENINLIKNETEKIEKSFREHVYLKDNEYARLLNANKLPGEYEDVVPYLKNRFFKDVGMNFDEIFN